MQFYHKITRVYTEFSESSTPRLLHFGESIKRLNYFVAFAVELTAKNDVVKRVGKQVLNHENRSEFSLSNVFPVIVLAALM